MRWKQSFFSLVTSLGVTGLFVSFLIGISTLVYFAETLPTWTGFGSVIEYGPNGEILGYSPAKTLWDWLGLLIPFVSGVAVTIFVKRLDYKHARDIERDRVYENRMLEGQRIQETRTIENERSQDMIVKDYLDKMTELLLSQGLRFSLEGDEVRNVARAQTLMVLRDVDGRHRARILHFLYESRLIGYFNGNGYFDSVVELVGANLTGANLECMNLRGADLEGTNLRGANLTGVDLRSVDFRNSEGVSLDMLLKSKSFYGAVLPSTITKSNLQDKSFPLKKYLSRNLNRFLAYSSTRI